MASRQFQGNVRIVIASEKNLDNERVQVLKLEKNEAGKYSGKSVAALLTSLEQHSKKEKLPISRWAVFEPEGTRENCAPVLLANKYGQPYIAFFSKEKKQPQGRASTKRVLD